MTLLELIHRERTTLFSYLHSFVLIYVGSMDNFVVFFQMIPFINKLKTMPL